MFVGSGGPARNVGPTRTEKERERALRYSRNKHAKAADIGDLPKVKDPERRERCRWDLHAFLREYFPNSTGLSPFCDSQISAIKRIENAALNDGRVLNLQPRGFAKSTVSENATLWMMLYGHRRFVMFIAATSELAIGAIDSLQNELEGNELLAEDFPEVCLPIRHGEGKPQKYKSQTYNGERTAVTWTKDTIVLPTMPGADGSGSVVRAAGLLGATRGAR
ncbi:MAG: hypothetical protein AAFP90_06660, partial [Planctomycetota bacterium]